MSKWPWPQRLKRMVGDLPSSRAFDRMVRFRRRHDPFASGEQDARFETRRLMIGARLDEAKLLQVADQRRHAMIAQSPGVKARRDELRPKRMHLDEGG